MKSKIFTLIFICMGLFIQSLIAQPLNWRESSPEGWDPIIMEADFDNFTEGTASLKITFTETGTPYFVTDTFDVTASTVCNLSMDVLDNDPAAEVNLRIRFILDDGTKVDSTSKEYSVDNAAFQTYSYSATSPANAVKAFVIVRMYDVSDNWTTSGTFNLDNASFTQGGSNLITNPGFENWVVPVDGSTVDNWAESSPSDWTPITIEADNVNKSHGFLSTKITFTETGTPYFVCDTFDIAASTACNLSMDVLDNDPAAEVNLRIRFILDDGTKVDSTSKEYSVDNAAFQTYTYSATSPANAVKAFVIVRMYDVSDNWTTSGTFNLDNASFTQGGENLILNPSFEKWTEEQPSDEKDILSFKFAALNPVVNAILDYTAHTVSLEVPYETDVTSLVPTIEISEGASISPESGIAQDFTSAVTYTVTAEDESTQDWVVTVNKAAEGQTVLFFEDFEDINLIPDDWTIINNDGYTQAEGEERWQDSAWVVTTTSRDEFVGTKLAMASSYTSDMPETGKADDWMILPTITIGDNSTLSWQAMSTTSSGNYPDDYMVLIASPISGADPTISYFESDGNILLEVEPESWSESVSNPGEGKKDRSVNLKDAGWTDQDVWIAFVLTTDLYTNPTTGEPNANAGGSNLAIDNIKVVNDVSTGFNRLDKETFDARLFPNPTDGDFRIVFNSEINSTAQIEIFDITGRVVFDTSKEVKVGQNEFEFNVSNFNNGIYLISTNINNKVNVSKLIVK